MTNSRKLQAALPFLVVLSIASGASAASSVQVVSVQDAELLTGGVGEHERQQLLERAPEYDLFVSFAGRQSGAYVSGVRVTIEGRELEQPIVITTNGPLLLANLPEGHYTVSAELPGWHPRTRQVEIERGEHRSLWITFVPEDETAHPEDETAEIGC